MLEYFKFSSVNTNISYMVLYLGYLVDILVINQCQEIIESVYVVTRALVFQSSYLASRNNFGFGVLLLHGRLLVWCATFARAATGSNV